MRTRESRTRTFSAIERRDGCGALGSTRIATRSAGGTAQHRGRRGLHRSLTGDAARLRRKTGKEVWRFRMGRPGCAASRSRTISMGAPTSRSPRQLLRLWTPSWRPKKHDGRRHALRLRPAEVVSRLAMLLQRAPALAVAASCAKPEPPAAAAVTGCGVRRRTRSPCEARQGSVHRNVRSVLPQPARRSARRTFRTSSIAPGRTAAATKRSFRSISNGVPGTRMVAFAGVLPTGDTDHLEDLRRGFCARARAREGLAARTATPASRAEL